MRQRIPDNEIKQELEKLGFTDIQFENDKKDLKLLS